MVQHLKSWDMDLDLRRPLGDQSLLETSFPNGIPGVDPSFLLLGAESASLFISANNSWVWGLALLHERLSLGSIKKIG